MVRLVSGIGIYLWVVLLLLYASAVTAAERSAAESSVTARQAGRPAFDLEVLSGKAGAKRSIHNLQTVKSLPALEAVAGSNNLPGRPVWHFRGPALSYQTGLRGPVIEVGIFGGTVKPRQRLAHLALNWDF